MRLQRNVLFFCAVLLGFLQTPCCPAQNSNLFDPPALYLTWQRDPTTTMTIHWHTVGTSSSKVQYKKSHDNDWRTETGTSKPMPLSDRMIHTVELKGLEPKTDYVFRFADASKEFKFRTMPKDLNQPLRFIEGGDVYHQRDWMDQMNALAGRYDPNFVVFGGDLAYANNRDTKPENMQRWYDFFDSWKKMAVTPDGRRIPLLVTLGNHEVMGFWGKSTENAKGFYALFSMPGPQGYNVLDFGNYMTLFLLDSGLTHPVEGEQTEWLQKHLVKRQNVPHLFPVYHVPAWPSVRPEHEGENGDITAGIRKLWVPLFEKYGVKVAFEHHDHAFKRTHPLRGEKIDPQGVVYLGDGAWGVKLRPPEPDGPRWFMAKAANIRHFFLVTVFSDQRHILAVNDEGKFFDELYQRVDTK